MSAVVRGVEDEDRQTGQPIWRLVLSCGHEVTCGRHPTTPPTSRPGECRKCKTRAREQRKWIKRKAKRAAQREAETAKPTEKDLAWEAKIKTLMTIE
jgi:hypothetical protein